MVEVAFKEDFIRCEYFEAKLDSSVKMVRNAEEDLKLEPTTGRLQEKWWKGGLDSLIWDRHLSLGDHFIAVFILCGILLYGDQIKVSLMWKFLNSTLIVQNGLK